MEKSFMKKKIITNERYNMLCSGPRNIPRKFLCQIKNKKDVIKLSEINPENLTTIYLHQYQNIKRQTSSHFC